MTQTDICLSTFVVALFMRAKIQKQSSGLNRCKDEQNVEYKRSIIQPYKGMEFQYMVQHNSSWKPYASDTQKEKCMIPHTWNISNRQFIDT